MFLSPLTILHYCDSNLGHRFYGKGAGCSGRYRQKRGDAGRGKGRENVLGGGKMSKENKVGIQKAQCFVVSRKDKESGIKCKWMNTGIWL